MTAAPLTGARIREIVLDVVTNPDPGQRRNTEADRIHARVTDAAGAGVLLDQTKRALDYLAAQGSLVKVRRGDRDPAAGYRLRVPQYYTRGQYDAAVRAKEQRVSEAAARRSRWDVIAAELDRRGVVYKPRLPGFQIILVSPDEWDKLLT